jgi:hypothetical protein
MVLPHPRSMQAVVDRMRATAGPSLKHLILHADARKREVCLSVATAEVSIRTFYRGVMRDDGAGGGDGSSQSQEGACTGGGRKAGGPAPSFHQLRACPAYLAITPPDSHQSTRTPTQAPS